MSSGNPDTSELAPGVTVENKKISNEQNCLVVIASHLVNNTELLEQAVKALQPGGFLILREEPNETLALENFNILVDRLVDNKRILLLQKKVMSLFIVETFIYNNNLIMYIFIV